MLENMNTIAELYIKKYEGRPELDDALFKIRSNQEGVREGVV